MKDANDFDPAREYPVEHREREPLNHGPANGRLNHLVHPRLCRDPLERPVDFLLEGREHVRGFSKVPARGEQDIPFGGRREPNRQGHALRGKTLSRTLFQGVARSSGSAPSSSVKRSRIKSLCHSGTGISFAVKLSQISTTRSIRSSGGSSSACRWTCALVNIVSKIRFCTSESTRPGHSSNPSNGDPVFHCGRKVQSRQAS